MYHHLWKKKCRVESLLFLLGLLLQLCIEQIKRIYLFCVSWSCPLFPFPQRRMPHRECTEEYQMQEVCFQHATADGFPQVLQTSRRHLWKSWHLSLPTWRQTGTQIHWALKISTSVIFIFYHPESVGWGPHGYYSHYYSESDPDLKPHQHLRVQPICSPAC